MDVAVVGVFANEALQRLPRRGEVLKLREQLRNAAVPLSFSRLPQDEPEDFMSYWILSGPCPLLRAYAPEQNNITCSGLTLCY